MTLKIRKAFLIAVACLTALTARAACAGAIDSVSLNPSGADTNFTIAGTYTLGTPVTSFSSPNTPYSLTFTLATTPSTLAFVDTTDGVFGIDTTVTVNGVNFVNSQIVFFDSAGGGGLVVCLGVACNPTTLAPNFWDVLGPQLFIGTLSNPTFISCGNPETPACAFDSVNSGYVIASATPEPSSLLLLGTGLVGLLGWGRRKLSA